jgi:hypothetical protein
MSGGRELVSLDVLRTHPRAILVHTAWDLGSPLNTVVTYFQIIGAEIA